MSRRLLVVKAFVLAALSWACLFMQHARGEEFSESDALLAKIPDEPNVSFTPFVSHTGRVAALVRTAEGKSSVVVNGKEGERYDEVFLVQFNPAAKTVTYIARRGTKMLVVSGDRNGPEFDKIPYFHCVPSGLGAGIGQRGGKFFAPAMIPDGETFAYWGVKDNQWTFFFGDRKWEGFADSDHRAADGGDVVWFSPDGKHIAFEARYPDHKWAVITDQNTGKKSSKVSLIGITDDGQPVYRSFDNDVWTLFVGARKIGEHAQFGFATDFTPDGSRVVYSAAAQLNGPQFLFDNGKQVAPHYTWGPIVFSPDGKSYAFFTSDRGKTALVLNGKTAETSYRDCFGQPHFSPDGAQVVYCAQKSEKKQVVVLDGVESAEFDRVSDAVFSPDGKTVGFTGSDYSDKSRDPNFMVIGGKKERDYPVVNGLVFSSDSKHYAYIAELPDRKGQCVILDGKPGAPFAGIDPPLAFSANGSLVYKARGETGGAFVVAGDKTYSNGDLLLTPLLLNSARTKVGYATQKGNEVWWKVAGE